MSETIINILTYNIHKGFSVANRRFVLHDIKESLRQVNSLRKADWFLLAVMADPVGAGNRSARITRWLDPVRVRLWCFPDAFGGLRN